MLSEAFSLGLSTGAYCAAACFPVAVPFLLSEKMAGASANARLLGLFLLGRLAAYMLMGFALGSLGQLTSQSAPAWLGRLAPAVYLVLGLVMVASGLRVFLPHWSICAWVNRFYRPEGGAFWYGALTGVNPCPPFLAAAARVFGQAGGWGGAAYFGLFFLGTTVIFVPLLGAAWMQRQEPLLLAAARVALVLVGGYFAVVLGILPLVL